MAKQKKDVPTIKTATTEQLAMELNRRWTDLMTAQAAISEINQELQRRAAKQKPE